MGVILSIVTFGLMVGVLVDIIVLDTSRVRFLGKGLWIIVVILLPLVGSVLWLLLGREYQSSGGYSRPASPRESARQAGHPAGAGNPHGPRDTAAELAALEREIAAYERAERIRDLEAELEAKKRKKRLEP